MTEYDYVHKAIDSCVTAPQVETAHEWALRLHKAKKFNYSCFNLLSLFAQAKIMCMLVGYSYEQADLIRKQMNLEIRGGIE